MFCGICGGTSFSRRPVLWQQLITDWQISDAEADYIDRQQGETCDSCGANLRSIALANAIRSFLRTNELLCEVVETRLVQDISILEINEAGMLTPYLRKFGRYLFGAYPAVDIHCLPYNDDALDLVVHSDTLEHVKNPVHALKECRRIIKPRGAICFTIPIIMDRLSRSREGLPKSFHGCPSTAADDFVVHTEFGSDAWTYIAKAGFSDISIQTIEYPAAIAFTAWKD